MKILNQLPPKSAEPNAGYGVEVQRPLDLEQLIGERIRLINSTGDYCASGMFRGWYWDSEYHWAFTKHRGAYLLAFDGFSYPVPMFGGYHRWRVVVLRDRTEDEEASLPDA